MRGKTRQKVLRAGYSIFKEIGCGYVQLSHTTSKKRSFCSVLASLSNDQKYNITLDKKMSSHFSKKSDAMLLYEKKRQMQQFAQDFHTPIESKHGVNIIYIYIYIYIF